MGATDLTKTLISEFREKRTSELAGIPDLSEKLREACRKIERSWSASFTGWHGKMYYRDFQTPSIHEQFSGEWGAIRGIPEGWTEKWPEEVVVKVEELVGDNFSVGKFENDIKKFREEAEQLKKEIIIAFSSFNFDTSTVKEKELFTQIENFKFGMTKEQYINDRMPKTVFSRDSEALRQGLYLPSWLYYEGVALEGQSISEAVKNFIDITNRLIRQLEMKAKTGDQTISVREDPLASLHPDIYSKCHELYETRAYPEAVEKGFKVVRDKLRTLTGYETGSEAFGRGRLHINGTAAPNVDKDFNEGVKFLTMAIDRFRNEKSHTSNAKIDHVRAYEYLNLSSLAMKLLENAEILP